MVTLGAAAVAAVARSLASVPEMAVELFVGLDEEEVENEDCGTGNCTSTVITVAPCAVAGWVDATGH